MRNNNGFTTQTCHPELDSGSSIKLGSCSKIADQARNDKICGNLGFTLIELLVVVLIIAILGAVALPKYMVARDKARFIALMTIGKNVKDAMDRYRLSSGTEGGSPTYILNLLDISFKDYEGDDCNSTTCRIKVSGREYYLYPYLNHGTYEDVVMFISINDTSFGYFYTQIEGRSYENYMYCLNYGANTSVESNKCRKIARGFGSTCSDSAGACYW